MTSTGVPVARVTGVADEYGLNVGEASPPAAVMAAVGYIGATVVRSALVRAPSSAALKFPIV